MFDISRGKKHFFFKKCPYNGLVSEKKYIEKFSILGGEGGSDPSMENSILFFFLKASLIQNLEDFSLKKIFQKKFQKVSEYISDVIPSYFKELRNQGIKEKYLKA